MKDDEKFYRVHKVLEFEGETVLDLSADKVLKNNVGHFSKVILIGIDANGEFCCASSMGSVAEQNLLVDRWKRYMINSLED